MFSQEILSWLERERGVVRWGEKPFLPSPPLVLCYLHHVLLHTDILLTLPFTQENITSDVDMPGLFNLCVSVCESVYKCTYPQ